MAIEITDVYNALGIEGTDTLINSIRNSTEFKGMTDIYDGSVEGLRDFGVAVNSSDHHQNVFVNALVDRIGKVIVNYVQLRNPLKMFKKGRMPYGRSVEEIYTDLVDAESFDPDDASETIYKRYPPNVKVIFHDNWRKELYPSTIEETTIEEAFTSEGKFEEFVTSIFNAIYNSAEVDEYLWTKALVESYVANGYAKMVEVPEVIDEITGKEYTKAVRKVTTRLTLPQGSRNYNAMGVHTTTPKSRLYVIQKADIESTLSVDVLAYAYQMAKADIEVRTLLVEDFSVKGLEAVILDEKVFKIYDKVFKTKTKQNEKGLYYNVFLHVHQLFSMSKFHNVVAFMIGDIPNIQRVILSPMTTYVKLNKGRKFKGSAEVVGKLSDYEIKTELVNSGGTKITSTGATISTVEVDDKTGQFTFDVTVKDDKLKSQTLLLNLTVSEKAVEGETKELLSRTVHSVLVVQ